MKDLLILGLVALILLQGVVIVGLVGLVKKCRKEKRTVEHYYKALNKGLITGMLDIHTLAQDYKDAYEACYMEYSKKFNELKCVNRMYKELKITTERLQDSYDIVCYNMTQAIREGRLIKDRSNISTYEFNNLTKGEVVQLFGNTAICN